MSSKVERCKDRIDDRGALVLEQGVQEGILLYSSWEQILLQSPEQAVDPLALRAETDLDVDVNDSE